MYLAFLFNLILVNDIISKKLSVMESFSSIKKYFLLTYQECSVKRNFLQWQLYSIYYEAIAIPAALQVAQHDWKLKPPVTASIFKISHAKYSHGDSLLSMVS